MLKQDGDDAAFFHKRNMLSSQILLRRLQRCHYEHAPDSYKDRFLPSTIVGNPLINLISIPPKLPPVNDDDIPSSVLIEEFKASQTGSVKTILTAVSHYYRISVSQIVGGRNDARLVRARHIAMYLAHEHTTLSCAALGRAFGKDHTVIIFAKRKIEKEILRNQVLALQISIIRQQIEALNTMPTPVVVSAVRAQRKSKWTRESEVLLVRSVDAGKGWLEIGRMLNMTASTVFGKYKRLSNAAAVIHAAHHVEAML